MREKEYSFKSPVNKKKIYFGIGWYLFIGIIFSCSMYAVVRLFEASIKPVLLFAGIVFITEIFLISDKIYKSKIIYTIRVGDAGISIFSGKKEKRSLSWKDIYSVKKMKRKDRAEYCFECTDNGRITIFIQNNDIQSFECALAECSNLNIQI